MSKQRIFSGIQPSGNLHLGNYLGAIKNWVDLQNQYESIFCVVDMHAITVPQDPAMLRKKTLEIAKIYLAAGIDPQKSTIFVQSHVKAHAELCWILNTITGITELEKMTQFKDKAGIKSIENYFNVDEMYKEISDYDEARSSVDKILFKSQLNEKIKKGEIDEMKFHEITRDLLLKMVSADEHLRNSVHRLTEYLIYKENTRKSVYTGLFDYPVLMAADIILYDTVTVPVGEDQVQHVELARTLARRFNKRFGETFVVPEYFIREEGMRIMGLDDPMSKMSKSAASEYNYIALADDAETIRKKIRKAVTDSGEEIVYRDDKPALKNLINIYAILAGMGTQDVEKKFVGKRYGDFKNDLAEVIIEFLMPFQERMRAISDEDVLTVLREGAQRAEQIAERKMFEVKEKVGFII